MHDIDNTANEIIDQLTNESLPTLFEAEGELAGVDNETELAMELLGASSDAELDQFFRNFLKKAVRVGSGLLRGPAGQLLRNSLRGLARKALPMAGTAVGSWFGGPAGGALGGKLAGMAGSALGLEGEMSDSELEEEAAKRVLRIAKDAAVQVARDVQAGSEPRTAVTQALQNAMRQHLPGIGGQTGQRRIPRAGRWVRQGQRIVLLGVY